MLDPRLNHAVAVAQGGSFTRAAELVGVTQSAVTKSIADLERELGYTVFYRTSRGTLLTEKGREFVERATRLLEDARALLRGSADRGDPHAGVLRIGVCPPSLEWLLAQPLAGLLARHPGIRFEVSGASFERMVQLLRGGSVDVAVGFEAAFAEWSDLRRHPIAALEVALFVRKGHPLLTRAVITPRDLAEFDFVAPSDSRPYGRVVRDLYESQGQEWQKRLHIVDCFPIARRLVATTDALGVCATDYVGSPGFAAAFAVVDGFSLFPPSPMCCATRSRFEPSAAARAFLSTMREKLPRNSP